jgi:hypothetical protein
MLALDIFEHEPNRMYGILQLAHSGIMIELIEFLYALTNSS